MPGNNANASDSGGSGGQTTTSQSLQIRDSDDEPIDAKIKHQVLKLRQIVNDDERRLYVDRVRTDPRYTQFDANEDWQLSIRQYLREIKRLWPDGEDVPIPNIDYYWREIELSGEFELVPPDKNGFQFSVVENREHFGSDRELREAIGLGPHGDIPEPKTVKFTGLSSILEKQHIEKTWVITTHKDGAPPEHNTEVVSLTLPIPKHVLENAIEAADNFLQQTGLGFDITMPAYMGDGDPGL